MNPILTYAPARALFAAICLTLLSACATEKAPRNAVYDFGPSAPMASMPASAPASPPIPAVVVTDVTGSPAFDTERMVYRLNYADPLQSRLYNNSKWSATPLQMLTQRIKSRLGQTGVKVLSATDAAAGVMILRMDMDDFTHNFDSVSQSYGQVVLRASLFQDHRLVDQRTFTRRTAASSADAGGGARALAASADAIAADMVSWMASLPVPSTMPTATTRK